MNQNELLNLAIEKAGGKKALSELTGLRLAFFYEWEKGVSMKFDVMIKILESVGLTLNVSENSKDYHIIKNADNIIFEKEEHESLRKFDCGCVIEDGILRRDFKKNPKCKLNKSEHKI